MKKIIHDYTFSPSTNTVVLKGLYDLKRLLMITNVTDNKIIYTFNSPTIGMVSSSKDFDTETTILVLEHDCSDMSGEDNLQIFLETDEVIFEPSETFVDPVSKIRVSTPENLIDTDFEYGLQSTKWETLELSNNVPSFYISDSDLPIDKLVSVEATTGSNIITVRTEEPHGLAIGTPIDVKGLSSRTGEGKFLIKTVNDDYTFTFESNGAQTTTGNIGSIYTAITPGQFYAGSQIPFKTDLGLVTDNAVPSKITVTTPYSHGFENGSNFYLINSIGTKKLSFTGNLSANATDGRPIVDPQDAISSSVPLNLQLTETKEMRSTKFRKFVASDVNTSLSTINWPNHGFRNNDTLLYVPPSGDTQIGGLDRFQVYYVRVYDTNSIRLSAFHTNQSSSTITFSSTGTYNFGRAGLHMCYEIARIEKPYATYNTDFYTQNWYRGASSGWDLQEIGVNGLGGANPSFVFLFSPNGYGIDSNWIYYRYYTTYYNGNMNMPQNTITPSLYNFMEDFTRYRNYIPSTERFGSYFRQYNPYYYNGTGRWDPSYRSMFMIYLVQDEEADTFQSPNHGLSTGDTLSVTVSGSNFLVSTSDTNIDNNNSNANYGSGNYTVERVNNDRFKVNFAAGRNRLVSATGTYSITGNKLNPTRNSFFYEKHGFANGNIVKFRTGQSGVLPSTITGSITPDTRLNVGNLATAWNVFNASMNSYTSTLSGHQAVVLNGSANSSQPINSGVSSGSSLLYWFNLSNNMYLQSIYRLGGSYSPQNDVFFNRQSPTIVKDAAVGTPYANQGWSYIGTLFQQNASVPHYSLLWGYSDPNARDVIDFRIYHTTYAQTMSTYSQNNISYTKNGSSGWRASYGARYATSGSAAGYVEFTIAIWHEGSSGWTPSDLDTTYSVILNGNNSISYTSPSSYNSSYSSKVLKFRTFFMLASGATYGSTQVNALADKLVTDLANNFAYPSLTNNQDVVIDVVNNNRFRIRNTDGSTYDLTSSGTAALEFLQQGITGINDGAYPVVSVPTENQFVLQLPFESPDSILTFQGNAITNNLITITNGHFFLPGTPVVYNRNGNTAITGLVDLQTYYVYVSDENVIGLCETYQKSIQGEVINITAGSNVTHELRFSLVNGRTAGVGSVKVVSGSKKIIGNTGTLFKRYFKVGDTIGIKNGTVSPAVIQTFVIAAIADDTNLELTDTVSFTSNDAKYFLDTKIYARPDGYAIHRPFDGGVEIAAGTAPYSQIVRQTRKYFRYQSGKGIQTSLAINFNPPVQFETVQGSVVDGYVSETLSEQEKTFTVTNSGASSYLINGEANAAIQLVRGVSYTFNINSTGHPFRIQTTSGAYNPSNEYTSGVFPTGIAQGTITFTVPLDAPSTLYYVCEIHSSMGGTINIVDDYIESYDYCRATTRYPHRLNVGSQIRVSGSNDPTYNGIVMVHKIIDDYTIDYILPQTPATSIPSGIIQFNMAGYSGSYIRAGMFDFQNGFFYEFDGTTLFVVRRSSTQQLSGSVTVLNKSNLVTGVNTNFMGQLEVSDKIVIRGQSYKVTKIVDRTNLIIQPEYKGVNASNVIITKTVDTRVPQSEWSLDHADGTGPSSFKLDINKIQMAYMDYSWYGAGKIRFGFKDNKGHVKYVHEFIHNNRMDEAYMRSGNMVARYEIENDANPTYAPTLFHWGTSVIMDGRFDDDKAYLFTATSRSLSFTNGASLTATTNAGSQLTGIWQPNIRSYNWYVRLQFPTADASKFSTGTKLYTADNQLNGREVAYTQFSGSNIFVFIFIQTSVFQPSGVPSVNSGVVVNIGTPASGVSAINLGTETIPLITIRLAPSIDSGLSGALGARDIINRMQLKLNEVGLVLTHDCEVKLVLNGDLSTVNWENIDPPSLSQLLRHDSGDKVLGGTEIFSFRASGGSTDNTGVRLSATSNFPLTNISDLGNSILGGDGTYPNGPDILTIAVKVVDTQGISATSPFRASSRITWSESQA
jgi:hypothetical protein